MLCGIRRSEILDISVNDIIEVSGFADVRYRWTAHDSEFVENNPDDDIFLEIECLDDKKFKARGIVLK